MESKKNYYINSSGKAYYEANKEKIIAKQKARYIKNKPQIQEVRRAYKLKKEYGLTVAQYEQMVSDQLEVCAICKTKGPKKLDVDHCHTTGKVRGLLCNSCNRGLGYFKDSVENLTTAIAYLKHAHQN